MKKFILFLVFAIFIASKIFSQDFIKKSNMPIDDKIRKTMATRIAVVDYQIIEIDLSQIQTKDFYMLDFFNHRIQLKKERIEKRGTDKYTLFAADNLKLNQSIITVSNNDIQGLVTIENEIFRIETLFDKILITKIDQSKYPPEKCNYNENPDEKNDSVPNYRQKDDKNYQPYDKKLYKTYPEQEFWNYQCKLRILVLYTTAAKNAKSNIENHIQLAIDEMNQSFINSGVNFQVELVFVGETTYQENNWKDDIKDFQNNGDGKIDNVHSLREKHSADVCVLVMNDSSLCGVARGIKTCSSHTFCNVYWDCATGYFSFSHEIGHLIGARHDPFVDSDNSPYQFGHGFVDPNDGWRTIMAYGNDCNGCTRIQWWSNPNKTRNGQAMGTTQTHDNTRLLNTYIPNVMSHRPSSGSRIVTQADISSVVGVIYHANKIETDGNVIIPNGHSWGFIAGNEVILNIGFQTESGSTFEAKLQPACGIPDGEPCNFNINFDLIEFSKTNKNVLFKIFPNPSKNNIINVKSYFEIEPFNVSLQIINSLGQSLQMVKLEVSKNEINLPNISSGVYFINFISDGKIIQSNKLIVQ